MNIPFFILNKLFYIAITSFDDINAEDLILNEKLARQLRTPLSKVIKKKGEFNLFDHFLVFGCYHHGNESSMKCIYKYPHNKM